MGRKTIYLSDELVAQIRLRADTPEPAEAPFAGVLISRELARYYALLARERARLRPQFSPAECALLLDACNGWLATPETIHFLPHEIEDALHDARLAEKWSVDGAALIAKLRGLSPGELFALVDAVERWWNGQEAADYGALLQEPPQAKGGLDNGR